MFAVIIAWAPEVNDDQWSLDLTKHPDFQEITVFNIVGKELARNTVTIGDSPVYIVGNKKSVRGLIDWNN